MLLNFTSSSNHQYMRSSDIHTSTQKPLLIKTLILYLKIINYIFPYLGRKIVLSLFCRPSANTICDKKKEYYKQFNCHIIKSHGYHVKYFSKGTGQRVLLTHGWGSNIYYMRHIIENLYNQGYEVVALDLPAHGTSSGTYINQITASKVIVDVIEKLEREKSLSHIVTHSWGGTSTMLAIDMLDRKKFQFPLLKKIITLSMPVQYESIINLFCDTLELNCKNRSKLILDLENIASVDNRTLEEAFPLALTNVYEKPIKFHAIHCVDDEAIRYNNTVQLVSKYKQITPHFVSGEGHHKILKDKQTITLIMDCLNHENLEIISN